MLVCATMLLVLEMNVVITCFVLFWFGVGFTVICLYAVNNCWFKSMNVLHRLKFVIVSR